MITIAVLWLVFCVGMGLWEAFVEKHVGGGRWLW